MSDPRIDKLASVLAHYSLEVKPGQRVILQGNPLAEELLVAAAAALVRAGTHVELMLTLDAFREVFWKYANDEQLVFVSPLAELATKTYDAFLYIGAPENTRMMSAIDPQKTARRMAALQPLDKIFADRAARGEMRWVYTQYPTHALAQEADMSLADYREFVFAAGKLNEENPVAAWRREGDRQRELKACFEGRDQVALKGKDIDLRLSIKDRTFVVADGRLNFPDGEIFTGPVEDSVNGWVRFSYPAIYFGREVVGVELWFENGRVVKESAVKGVDFLTAQLNTDPGARYLGEWGIGTNYDIPRFTKNMLFDEKLGGTIHLAVGSTYPETGGKNESGIHWDMLCDMSESEITVDGDLVYKDGKPIIWS